MPAHALLLTPGASASRNQPALVAIDEMASSDGMRVERMDFPYQTEGRKRIDSPNVLLAAVVAGAEKLATDAGVSQDFVALGGRSMGGRICSMAVAGGLPAAGLVLISYPLHPPGKPDKLRTEHFGGISVPCLFVSGTRDAFATPAELETATNSIAGAVTHEWIEGGDHSLRNRDSKVAEFVKNWLSSLQWGTSPLPRE